MPERVRENDGLLPFGCGSIKLLFREPPPARRLHTEGLECAVRDSKGAHTRGRAAVRQRRGAVIPHSDVCERPVLLPVREVHRLIRAQIVGTEARRGRLDAYELVRVRVRQRLDQHRVNDTEDRSRRADTEREREHGGEREGGPPQQRAERMAQIATGGIEESDHIHSAALPASGGLTARKAITVPRFRLR